VKPQIIAGKFAEGADRDVEAFLSVEAPDGREGAGLQRGQGEGPEWRKVS
tara:strand:+ start:9783 stop:9932 length:150 start_codon:yes stop_codon:yes gene_type:complete